MIKFLIDLAGVSREVTASLPQQFLILCQEASHADTRKQSDLNASRESTYPQRTLIVFAGKLPPSPLQAIVFL